MGTKIDTQRAQAGRGWCSWYRRLAGASEGALVCALFVGLNAVEGYAVKEPLPTMNTRNLLNLTRRSLLPLLFLFLTPAARLAAQEVSPTLVTNPPAFGTFYWLSGLPRAPFPFDPARGLLPLWSFNGAYYVDDSELLLSLDGGGEMLMGAPSPGGGGGSGLAATNFVCSGPTNFLVSLQSSSNLWLRLTALTNNKASLVMRTSDTNASYDVFGSTNLAELALPALSRTNWMWLLRAPPVPTNFNWLTCSNDQAWFQLGTMQDRDTDGLTDAYEQLVSHTATNVPNSPRSVYEDVISSQSPSNWFKLNDGSLTNAISGQPALTSTGTWDMDAFATGSNAINFNGTSQRMTAGDVINGGTGTNQGSMSLIFRSLNGLPTTLLSTQRYVLCQKGNANNEFGLFFETNTAPVDPGSLKVRIGSQTNMLLASNAIVFGTWYYLAMTWNESSNLATCYLAPIGGTLSTSNINLVNLGVTNVVGNSSNVFFGNRPNDAGTFVNAFRTPGNGALDQLAFWNRELTGAEVNAQFNRLNELFQGPAKVFDFTRWNILLPINSDGQLSGTAPLEIRTGWLNSGFRYVDPADWTQKYFYLSNGNTMVFEAPWNGAHTTTSSGARSELRGTLADGTKDNWLPLGTNTLEATCVVESAGTNNDRKVIIGQFHSETAADPPVVVSYNFPSNKNVTVTIKYSPTGSADQNYPLATGVNLGDLINYKLKLARVGGSLTLSATVNGTSTNVNMTATPYDPNWTNYTFYFKAGCYYPTNGPGSPAAGTAKVTFSSLTATHQ